MRLIFSTIIFLLVSSSTSLAAILHDETVDGDIRFGLPNFFLGVLPAGTSTIIGTVDAGPTIQPGDGPDEVENFVFQVINDFSVDLVQGFGSLNVTLFQANDRGYFNIDSISRLKTSEFDIFTRTSDLTVGTYMITYTSSIPGMVSYQFNINVEDGPNPPGTPVPSIFPGQTVPLPSSLPLAAFGMLVLGLLSRRRMKRS